MAKKKEYILLHVTILTWGLTGVIGKEISLSSIPLVWYRLLIAGVSLFLFCWRFQLLKSLKSKDILYALLNGVTIGIHWVCFFLSIKLGSVSLALSMLSAASLFTSFFEPLLFRRKIRLIEPLMGLVIIIGIFTIFQAETKYNTALIIGLVAAFFTAWFSTYNGFLIKKKKINVYALTAYEFLGAFVAVSLMVLFQHDAMSFVLDLKDTLLLLFLGTICTSVAMVSYTKVMQVISPFTANLNMNLEPIYGILLAILLYGKEEKMSAGFYIGGSIIILTIFIHFFWYERRKKHETS